jgi:hypothetical protein
VGGFKFKTKVRAHEPFILQDRVLVSALLFGSAGYIVMRSWEGVAMLVAGFMLAAAWAFRTAGSDRRRGLRLMATLLLVTLGTFLTVYVSTREGFIR